MNYNIISLDSFNPLDMNLIKSREKWYGKDDHSRWIFEYEDLYYKIWNDTYIRKDGVKLGIDCGFYDETTTPALESLIYYDDVCRGYVTKKCDLCFEDITPFYEIIKNKTIETNHFVYDFSKQHVVNFNDRYSLIDLEGVFPLSEYENIAYDRYNASFSSEEYREFVYEIYKNQ